MQVIGMNINIWEALGNAIHLLSQFPVPTLCLEDFLWKAIFIYIYIKV